MAIMSASDYANSSEFRAREAAAQAYRNSQSSSSSLGVPIPQATSGPSRVENQGMGAPQVVSSNVPMPNGYYAPQTVTPTVPMPPVRDMNAIRSYAESQVAARLDEANRARDLATGNLNTQAGQLTTQLNTQAEQQRQRLAATRQQALQGLQTGYGQAQQALTDQRNLQNVESQRNLNPFSGQTSYRQAMTDREREITDRNNSQIYNNQVGSLEQDYQNNTSSLDADIANRTAKIQQDLQMNLANVQKAWQDVANAAPAEKERLIKEATDQERAYQMALRNADRDDVLLQLQQQKTVMEQSRLNQDILNQNRSFDLDLSKLGQQQYQFDQQLAETQKQNNVDNAMKLGQQYGVGVLPKANGQVLFEQVAGLPTVQAQQLAQEAERFGLEYALKKATQEHNISQDQADMLLKQAQLGISQQNAATSATNAATNAARASTSADREGRLATPKPKSEKPVSYKQNPEYADEMKWVYENPDAGVEEIQNNVQEITAAYGTDGYNALLSEARRVKKAAKQ